jgi:phosphate transport system substrate-binding protein
MRHSCARTGRPRLSCFLPALIFALLLSGCNGLSLSGNENASNRASRISIASSPVLVSLISAAVALFERQHPEAQIAVESTESLDGLSALAHQQVDIAATTLYADPSAAAAAHLLDELIGVVPFLIVVHPDVPVASLSQAQIQSIFSTGEITDWQQIGGPAQELVVVLPPLTSDTQFIFREEMLNGAAEAGNTLSTDSLEMLRESVARTPGSISYLPAPLLNARVREVAIDGEAATADEIAAGRYRFWSFAHLYSRNGSTPATEEIALFLQFIQSASVAQLARQLGYIPLAAMNTAPASVSLVARATSA